MPEVGNTLSIWGHLGSLKLEMQVVQQAVLLGHLLLCQLHLLLLDQVHLLANRLPRCCERNKPLPWTRRVRSA